MFHITIKSVLILINQFNIKNFSLFIEIKTSLYFKFILMNKFIFEFIELFFIPTVLPDIF